MNNRSFPFAAPLLLIALAACNPAGESEDAADTPADTAARGPADTSPPPAATMPPPDQPEPMAPGEGAAPSQPEALALLIAIDEHEIAAAEQAREKQVEGEVLEFAEMMDSEHSKNLEATQELADGATEVADSPKLASLRASGEAELNRLSELEGQEYEQAYVAAMVEGHQKALDMLDDQLIPAAQDEAVRQHLAATRKTVAAHLEQAQALQSQ